MKCPSADQLAQLHDELLTAQEAEQLKVHVKNCPSCQAVMELFEGESRFMKETLQTPGLSEDFADLVLTKLEPYKLAKKKSYWKRALLSAAGVALAFGITATVSPSFAQLVGGLFNTDSVDEGVHIAMDAGLVERVDLTATDKGITLKVEDVMVDSSRLVFSYQVLKSSGKTIYPYFELHDSKNEIVFIDEEGNEIQPSTSSWGLQKDNYGLFEFSLREGIDVEKFTVQMRVQKIGWRTGEWSIDIPIDLTEINKLTKRVPLGDQTFDYEGVTVTLQETQYAPSANELIYQTSLTDELRADYVAQREEQTKLYGEQHQQLSTKIGYYIENDSGDIIASNNVFTSERGHPVSNGYIHSGGRWNDEVPGEAFWMDSFIPQTDGNSLSFVLDGVYKTVPVDYAVVFKPDELNRADTQFDYGGNYLTIKSIKRETNYSLRKSWLPIQRERYVEVILEGSREAMGEDLQSWVLQDDAGNSYRALGSGGTSDEVDEHGRYKMTVNLHVYGIEKITDTMTLRLTQVERYEQLAEPWRVPLYK